MNELIKWKNSADVKKHQEHKVNEQVIKNIMKVSCRFN